MKVIDRRILVDDEDFERLSRFTWHIQPNGRTFYAFFWKKLKNGRPLRVYMHMMLIPAVKGIRTEVDHKDGNGLNNQKENLRRGTHTDNMHNRHSVEDHARTLEESAKLRDTARIEQVMRLDGFLEEEIKVYLETGELPQSELSPEQRRMIKLMRKDGLSEEEIQSTLQGGKQDEHVQVQDW